MKEWTVESKTGRLFQGRPRDENIHKVSLSSKERYKLECFHQKIYCKGREDLTNTGE